MAVRYYRLLIDRTSEDVEWSAVFPELGAASCGVDVNEAVRMALAAVAAWLEVTIDRGELVPAPTALDAPLPAWMTDDDDIDWASVLRVLVPVDVPDGALQEAAAPAAQSGWEDRR